MFKRILHEDWTMIVPFVSFFLVFGVFAVATIRALRMSRQKREHLASLPLDLDDESNTPQP
jgi:fucose 4-O-acetylase-like acetyltransferase